MINQLPGLVYESPDGGKTIYARKIGETDRHLVHIDEMIQKERQIQARLVKMREAIYMDDPAINDLLEKIEILLELKK